MFGPTIQLEDGLKKILPIHQSKRVEFRELYWLTRFTDHIMWKKKEFVA